MKVALLVNEFFTNELHLYNGFGGYGIIARNYVTEFTPCEDIHIETIIGVNNKPLAQEKILDDNKKVIFFPARPSGLNIKSAINWLAEKVSKNPDLSTRKFINEYDYDGYLSLEMQGVSYEILKADPHRKVILWLQDPRPESDWDELDSMSIPQSGYRPTEKVRRLARKLQDQNRLTVISQGKFLNAKGREFYQLDDSIEITYVPNPISVDSHFDIEKQDKENAIVFLGRLDSVKRPWLYFEIAKNLPNYIFYVCGQSHEQDLEEVKAKYADIPNLKFMGHVDGEEKINLLKKAKILVNTSIHEAVPVSFLEALSYGCLLVSCQNPDDMTSNYGIAIDQVWGDGYEMVEPFSQAVETLMENDSFRKEKAQKAVSYIRDVHSIESFTNNMRRIIRKTFQN